MWHACPVSCKSADKWKTLWDPSSSVNVRRCRRHGIIYLVPETLFISWALCTKFDMHVISVPIYQFWVSYFQACPCDTQFSTNFGHLTHCRLESVLPRRVSSSHVWVSSSHVIIPLVSTKWKAGYTDFTLSVCLSVCGQNRVRSASSTILAGFIHIYTSYQPTSYFQK